MKPEYKLKNKNILVTGGAGFIGSNLCAYLLDCKSIVTCLDNLSTGHKKNIDRFLNNPNFKFINGDIRKIETCQKACKGQDFVLHQAALGSVPRSIKNPIISNDVNVSGFLNMLVAARDQNVNRFIFASSSSTYGDSEQLPKKENLIGKPLSPYAITKYVNELYADIFNKSYGLNYIGLRYFNVFGRFQDPDGPYAAVIPIFIKKLIKYESPTINGDGSYSRDFTHIDNIIFMNVLCMITKNKEALNQIYNTASGSKTTLNELFNILKESLSKFDPNIKKIDKIHGPKRDGDIAHSLATTLKSKKLLSYIPIISFRDGIKMATNWFWKNKNIR